jgi:hypothetical protein
MTPGHDQARSYGGWRRSRGIGLLGLGPAATFILLGGFAAVLLVAAFSRQAALYVTRPAVLATHDTPYAPRPVLTPPASPAPRTLPPPSTPP